MKLISTWAATLGKSIFKQVFHFCREILYRFQQILILLNLKQITIRDNSYQKDIKGSLKIGYTPNATDEYSLNYQYSHGSKGNPVYLGTDKNTSVRYWQWPYWDKQSLYYISRTAIGKKSDLKARAYYDQFKNKLSSL